MTRTAFDHMIDLLEQGRTVTLVIPAIPEAPEPEQPGYTGRNGQGRRHGYISTYKAGCRCDLCRAGRRRAAVRDRATRRQRVTS